MKENLPAHHYADTRARNLGQRQLPREAEKAAEPGVLPAATSMPAEAEKAAAGRARKPAVTK